MARESEKGLVQRGQRIQRNIYRHAIHVNKELGLTFMTDGNSCCRTTSLEILAIQIGLFAQSVNFLIEKIKALERKNMLCTKLPINPYSARPDN